jgi:hypothetical protein
LPVIANMETSRRSFRPLHFGQPGLPVVLTDLEKKLKIVWQSGQ